MAVAAVVFAIRYRIAGHCASVMSRARKASVRRRRNPLFCHRAGGRIRPWANSPYAAPFPTATPSRVSISPKAHPIGLRSGAFRRAGPCTHRKEPPCRGLSYTSSSGRHFVNSIRYPSGAEWCPKSVPGRALMGQTKSPRFERPPQPLSDLSLTLMYEPSQSGHTEAPDRRPLRQRSASVKPWLVASAR